MKRRCASAPAGSRASVAVSALIAGLFFISACRSVTDLALMQHVEARRLAAAAHLEFTKAADASNLAVMADADEASLSAAKAAGAATQLVRQHTAALEEVLQTLDYPNELQILGRFNKALAEYIKVDQSILTLAVENTNVKAERLMLGAGREAAEDFRGAIKSLAHTAPPRDAWHVRALVASASAGVLEVQTVQARHIVEADEPVMSTLEAQIADALKDTEEHLAALRDLMPKTPSPSLDAAATALEQFKSANTEIIQLSRRNTDVRSLALALGHKRTLAATCDATLQELEDSIGRHEFKASR